MEKFVSSDDLPPALLEYTVHNAVPVQQRAEWQKILLNRHAEDVMEILHQSTSALLQRSLSLQLA